MGEVVKQQQQKSHGNFNDKFCPFSENRNAASGFGFWL
jgi:hypothetical protein